MLILTFIESLYNLRLTIASYVWCYLKLATPIVNCQFIIWLERVHNMRVNYILYSNVAVNSNKSNSF